MPASVLLAPVVPPVVRPGPVRLVRSGRGCPACGDSYCFNPGECLFFLTSRAWADCDRCVGSGWADEDSFAIFCEFCAGSGLDEYDLGTLPVDAVSEGACARVAAHVERLTALVNARRTAVVA
ncbi:hypothetical protein OG292_33640 [Streptomyces sp. NBC_01511]|uniref:hypothetical protein n=1 Tax=Streptomyces sp. NBC_01511 TaxID=2903889 RepID=UPI0038630840